ncbi:MAG TPA: hypothetical protein VIR63_06060 [Pontiella sp.]
MIMSDTDIYKNREPMPVGAKQPRKNYQRRRNRVQHPFDDKPRQRRSKNSGLRRFLHLSRKSENEKFFWVGTAVIFVTVLLFAAIWQYLIIGKASEKKADEKTAASASASE